MDDLPAIVQALWAFRVPIGIGIGALSATGAYFAYKEIRAVHKSMFEGDELPIDYVDERFSLRRVGGNTSLNTYSSPNPTSQYSSSPSSGGSSVDDVAAENYRLGRE